MDEKKFAERMQRVEDAVQLKGPDRVPVCLLSSLLPFWLDGCTNKDAMYNYPRAAEAVVKFHERFPMLDTSAISALASGKAYELAKPQMVD